ncbi:hypothetical protein DFS34DRAFT_598082 [Phlyctochytrium arcticum]|nr:hypothetical protein DFS34DRAFT_598082 [Phlyctochytrium arcticum]
MAADAAAASGMKDLCVRCPSYPTESFQVKVRPEWTVLQLKQSVSDMFPNRPPAADMRIIHSGKLLDNSASLQTVVFGTTAATAASVAPTVHLVVKSGLPSLSTSSPASSPSLEGLRRRQAAGISSAPPLSHDIPAGYNAQASIPNHVTLPTPTMQFQSPHNNTPLMALPFPYQVVLINGMPYAMHPAVYPPPTLSTPFPSPATAFPFVEHGFGHPAPHFTTPAAEPNPQPAPAPPAPAPAQAAGAPILNAGFGGAAANPEDEFGDQARNAPQNPFWLLLKLSFMVYMFSHNSSLTRIILMNAVAMVIFLVQTGRLRVIRRQILVPNVPLQAREPAPEAATPSTGGTAPASASLNTQATQRGFLSQVRNVVLVFFTSLIPDPPE